MGTSKYLLVRLHHSWCQSKTFEHVLQAWSPVHWSVEFSVVNVRLSKQNTFTNILELHLSERWQGF